jgi:NADH-quinone oxidoreductase subunit E
MTTNTPANIQPIPNSLQEQPGFLVPEDISAEVDELLTHYPHARSASLMILHLFQERFGFISRQAVEWTAVRLKLAPINIYELVTFYPMFHRSKVGRYHLKVCRTLSCALAGSYDLHRLFCEKLGLDSYGHGPQTTPDGRFTIEFVECLASCGTAPVVMCNDRFYESVTKQQAEELLSNTHK